ncbi:MAG: winged helix-turn-helix transcriptional regulator [Actinobacteria bacterium]|nr:winged helix-turn-helix transcriptional regulator [Actinomycetota bacterium]
MSADVTGAIAVKTVLDDPTTGPALAEPPGEEPTGSDQGDVRDYAEVADAMVRLTRAFARLKNQFLAEARDSVEWSAHLLINTLTAEGPMRSSALAEAVQSDPSTISRQVQALVNDGFVERRADPADGRASVLVVTDRGRRVHLDHKRLRNQHYQTMLAGWTPEELHTLTQLLARFTDDLDAARPSWLRSEQNPEPEEN